MFKKKESVEIKSKMSQIKDKILTRRNYLIMKDISLTTGKSVLKGVNFTRKSLAKLLYPERILVQEINYVQSKDILEKLDKILKHIDTD